MKTKTYLAAAIMSFAALTARAQDPWIANTNYPMDTNACVGATVSFRVIANTTNSPMTIQWQHDETELPRATNAVLIITNVSMADAGSYLAWVSNASGGFTNSRTANLTVHPAQFEDVTVSAGVTNAPGYCISAAWGDYNNDPFIDLYLAIGANTSSSNALFRNNGNGTFTRVGTAAGPIATDRHDSSGCAWIDFNNDGYRDMFVLNSWNNPSRNDLYWNNGDGTFRSGNAGNLTQLSQVRSWPASADYDGDGWVDIFVAEGNSGTSPVATRLYHSTGTGTFASTNLGPTQAYVNDAVWGDYDNDGDPDLFICGYTSASTLWRNDGRGNFTPVANGLPSSAQTLHACWADYDRDGDLDIALSSFSDTRIYRNDGANGFVLEATLATVTAGAWADYDNDGLTDLLITGGQGMPRKPGLFHNDGNGNFRRVSDIFTEVPDNSLACPWGDFDNDGFMDVILTHQYSQHRLYRNLGNTNHWIKFKLVGTASNRDAIGAKVRVQATIAGQSVWQMQEVNGGYQWQNDTRLNFGLGDATTVDLVRIEWPSGNVQELVNLTPNQIITVTEAVNITPARPSVSLNGAVTLTRTALAGATYQWHFDGVDLVGQTNRILNLTNITADMAGRYSVVVSNATTLTTNFVYLQVDTTFTKITQGPIVNDRLTTWYGYWGDYDNDGRLDVLVNGNTGQWRLYHNEGGTMFSTVTNGAMGEYNLRAMYGVWADLDNDDDLDLFAGVSADVSTMNMFWNDGDGDFTRVPVPGVPDSRGAPGNAWGDFDRDGFVDVFVASVDEGASALFHNNGDGTFTVVTNTMRFPSDTVQVTCTIDYDNDGDLDLVPVRWGVQPTRFYRNDGRGTFTEATPQPIRSDGIFSLSAAWGDFDNDGDLDVIFGGWENRSERFYINNGDGTFTRWAGQPTLFEPYGTSAGSSLSWGDFDNDGYLDLAVTKGDALIRLWRNRGDGSFAQVLMGSLVNESGTFNQSGCWVDFNQDGNLDFFVPTLSSGVDRLYMGNGNGNHWLEVKPKGTRSNRLAIGARIFATATIGGKVIRQMRVITASDGDQSLIAHFGLGNATTVSQLRIEWPSGTVQELSNVATNQMLTITEPRRPVLALEATPTGFTGTLNADGEQTYQVQASEDLAAGWTVLTNITTDKNGTAYWSDSAVSPQGRRFYKAVRTP
jgi:hypothetical protein